MFVAPPQFCQQPLVLEILLHTALVISVLRHVTDLLAWVFLSLVIMNNVLMDHGLILARQLKAEWCVNNIILFNEILIN